jgi:hypothetical protein
MLKFAKTNLMKHLSREERMTILIKALKSKVIQPHKRNFFFRMKFIRTIPNINNFKQLKMYYNAVISKNLVKNKLLHCLVKHPGLKHHFRTWKRNTLDQQKQRKL